MLSVSRNKSYPWLLQAEENTIEKISGSLQHQRKYEEKDPDLSKIKRPNENLTSGTVSPEAAACVFLWVIEMCTITPLASWLLVVAWNNRIQHASVTSSGISLVCEVLIGYSTVRWPCSRWCSSDWSVQGQVTLLQVVQFWLATPSSGDPRPGVGWGKAAVRSGFCHLHWRHPIPSHHRILLSSYWNAFLPYLPMAAVTLLQPIFHGTARVIF